MLWELECCHSRMGTLCRTGDTLCSGALWAGGRAAPNQKGFNSCLEAKSLEKCTSKRHLGWPCLEDIHIEITTSLILPTHTFSRLSQISVSYSRPGNGRVNPRKYEDFFSTFTKCIFLTPEILLDFFLNNLHVFLRKCSDANCLSLPI